MTKKAIWTCVREGERVWACGCGCVRLRELIKRRLEPVCVRESERLGVCGWVWVWVRVWVRSCVYEGGGLFSVTSQREVPPCITLSRLPPAHSELG